jgi:hypothetical protein
MKLRKIAIICSLVILALCMMVVPVAAGKLVKYFTWQPNGDPTTWTWVTKETGVTTHWIITIEGTVMSDIPELNNGTYHIDADCSTRVNPNPNGDSGLWGSCRSKWRIDTAAGVAQDSGFEGVSSALPMAMSDKFPRGALEHASGTGFGAYKNMSIKFGGELWVIPYTGEIR